MQVRLPGTSTHGNERRTNTYCLSLLLCACVCFFFVGSLVCMDWPLLLSLIQIQYKHEYYYSGINPAELRGHSKTSIIKTIVKN